MTLEQRVQILERNYENLNKAFLQAQRNQVPVTGKVDDTSNHLNNTDVDVERNTADIDYIAMMSDIEIPTEE